MKDVGEVVDVDASDGSSCSGVDREAMVVPDEAATKSADDERKSTPRFFTAGWTRRDAGAHFWQV